MKKVKFMLTAIAVFAVVGAGLAFKASKGNPKTFYSQRGVVGGNTTCDVAIVLQSKTTTPANPGTDFATYSTTSSTQGACTGIRLTADL